jgi:hypothetical protein
MRVLENPADESEGDAQLTPSYLYKVAYSVLIDEIRRDGPRVDVLVPDHERDFSRIRRFTQFEFMTL